jgi:hypothetical protein
MLFLKPCAFQFRSRLSFSHTNPTMSGLRHQAPNRARCQGCNRRHIQQARSRPPAEGHQRRKCSLHNTFGVDALVPEMYFPESSLLILLRNVWGLFDYCGRQTARAVQRHRAARVAWSLPYNAAANFKHRVHQNLFSSRRRTYFLRTPEERFSAAKMASPKRPAHP